jgi:hypothetical protein
VEFSPSSNARNAVDSRLAADGTIGADMEAPELNATYHPYDPYQGVFQHRQPATRRGAAIRACLEAVFQFSASRLAGANPASETQSGRAASLDNGLSPGMSSPLDDYLLYSTDEGGTDPGIALDADQRASGRSWWRPQRRRLPHQSRDRRVSLPSRELVELTIAAGTAAEVGTECVSKLC